MYTVSDILADIDRGIQAHNMIEDKFSYRIIYFVNDGNKGTKFRVDTSYNGLRATMENIIKRNLTTTNTVVLAQTTIRKNGATVSLLSKSYPFSLDGYFQKICESKEKDNVNGYYIRRKVQWC